MAQKHVIPPSVMLLIFVLMGIPFFYFSNKKDNEINDAALSNLDLRLTGVVDSIDRGENFHGYGITRLRVLNSNYQYYDKRKSLRYYFCVIENGEAEIYEGNYSNEIAIGDTLFYDTNKRVRYLFKNGEKQMSNSIWIIGEDDYYNYIKEHTIFK